MHPPAPLSLGRELRKRARPERQTTLRGPSTLSCTADAPTPASPPLARRSRLLLCLFQSCRPSAVVAPPPPPSPLPRAPFGPNSNISHEGRPKARGDPPTDDEASRNTNTRVGIRPQTYQAVFTARVSCRRRRCARARKEKSWASLHSFAFSGLPVDWSKKSKAIAFV